MDKRETLIKKIFDQYDDGVEIPVVELDEFFDGNPADYSIAPNLVGDGHPGITRFWEILRSVRDRENVDYVLVGIHECPELDDPRDANEWPSAENIYLFTTADSEEVEGWVRELKTDGVSGQWPYGKPERAPDLRPGYKVQTLFWD